MSKRRRSAKRVQQFYLQFKETSVSDNGDCAKKALACLGNCEEANVIEAFERCVDDEVLLACFNAIRAVHDGMKEAVAENKDELHVDLSGLQAALCERYDVRLGELFAFGKYDESYDVDKTSKKQNVKFMRDLYGEGYQGYHAWWYLEMVMAVAAELGLQLNIRHVIRPGEGKTLVGDKKDGKAVWMGFHEQHFTPLEVLPSGAGEGSIFDIKAEDAEETAKLASSSARQMDEASTSGQIGQQDDAAGWDKGDLVMVHRRDVRGEWYANINYADLLFLGTEEAKQVGYMIAEVVKARGDGMVSDEVKCQIICTAYNEEQMGRFLRSAGCRLQKGGGYLTPIELLSGFNEAYIGAKRELKLKKDSEMVERYNTFLKNNERGKKLENNPRDYVFVPAEET